MSHWQRMLHRQEEPDPLCPLCWQAHVSEPCPLEGRDCFVLHCGAYERGKEPVSQRQAQVFYRFVQGKTTPSCISELLKITCLHQSPCSCDDGTHSCPCPETWVAPSWRA